MRTSTARPTAPTPDELARDILERCLDIGKLANDLDQPLDRVGDVDGVRDPEQLETLLDAAHSLLKHAEAIAGIDGARRSWRSSG